MSSLNSDNIPQEINKVLTATNKYEQMETKVVNHILTSSDIVPILKQKCQEILIKDENQSIEEIIKQLSINSADDILKLDPKKDQKEMREQLKDIIIKQLQEILY